jgi:hypothetical protein
VDYTDSSGLPAHSTHPQNPTENTQGLYGWEEGSPDSAEQRIEDGRISSVEAGVLSLTLPSAFGESVQTWLGSQTASGALNPDISEPTLEVILDIDTMRSNLSKYLSPDQGDIHPLERGLWRIANSPCENFGTVSSILRPMLPDREPQGFNATTQRDLIATRITYAGIRTLEELHRNQPDMLPMLARFAVSLEHNI